MALTEVYKWIRIRMGDSPLDLSVYSDALGCLVAMSEENGGNVTAEMVTRAHELRHFMGIAMRKAAGCDRDFLANMYDLNRNCLFFTAPVCFDDFLMGMEYDAPESRKFYKPRRHYLAPMVQGYQDLHDGKLKLLTVSQPKRTGKSQTELLFVLWLAGANPDKSALMEGAGAALITSFYKGALEYLVTPNEYNFYRIYPGMILAETNAETKVINLNSKKRFPTLMCRSIDAIQVGLSEATLALTLDDCVEGREEAKNRERLDAKWDVLRGDVVGRAVEGTPIVLTGTRYSLYDPIGRMQEFARSRGWNWRAIEIPALDPKTDETNYLATLYDGSKIFTTEWLRDQRALLSAEQWESEFQQQPFEAKGILYPKDSLNYFFELPVDTNGKTIEADTTIAVCDTAERGEDYTALLIASLYGTDVYIIDVYFSDAPPEVTKPGCAHLLMKYQVSSAMFESNAAGMYYARDVGNIIEQRGGKVGIRTKRSGGNKQTRIDFSSDNVKKNFYFRDETTLEPGSPYQEFMRQVTTYTRTGKSAHDDAVDALSLLETEIRNLTWGKVEIFKRFF